MAKRTSMTSSCKIKKRKKAIQAFVTALIIAFVGIIPQIGQFLYTIYRDIHPAYPYEKDFSWINIDEAESIFGNNSHVTVFNANQESYNSAAVLSVLFNNESDHDRTITSFTVHAEDIVEDYSPVLSYSPVDTFDPIAIDIFNDGWGETGPITITVLGLTPNSEDDYLSPVKINLQENATKEWSFPSLKSGEERKFAFLSEDDFEIIYEEPLEELAYFDLLLKVEAVESGLEESLTITICITPDEGIHIMSSGGCGPTLFYYVVEVDTSNSQWTETYQTAQHIPAHKTIYFPIYIAPIKSCNMSVWIEFEMSDGETMRSDTLINSHFIVPYNDVYSEYVDGRLLDLDVQEERVICFPFVPSSTLITKTENGEFTFE